MKRQRESEDVEIILPKSMKTSHAKTTRKDTRQGFFLNSISDFGPASRQNANSICIRDILANDEDSGEAMEEVILCNYMIDLVPCYKGRSIVLKIYSDFKTRQLHNEVYIRNLSCIKIIANCIKVTIQCSNYNH
eukprot:GHVP01060945.1.p1 GENE.GHVP01060945.1~~GHVP01060945.1.p1  ORF type:complete len:134 (-),score=17.78 GHVP01060945.1:534-935(-)